MICLGRNKNNEWMSLWQSLSWAIMVFHILLISSVLVLLSACDHVCRQQTEQPKYYREFLGDFIAESQTDQESIYRQL